MLYYEVGIVDAAELGRELVTFNRDRSIGIRLRDRHANAVESMAATSNLSQALRGIHAELVKSSGAELIVQRTLAADEPLSGLADGLATILIDFDELSSHVVGDQVRDRL